MEEAKGEDPAHLRKACSRKTKANLSKLRHNFGTWIQPSLQQHHLHQENYQDDGVSTCRCRTCHSPGYNYF
jgi:hypothetical protein